MAARRTESTVAGAVGDILGRWGRKGRRGGSSLTMSVRFMSLKRRMVMGVRLKWGSYYTIIGRCRSTIILAYILYKTN